MRLTIVMCLTILNLSFGQEVRNHEFYPLIIIDLISESQTKELEKVDKLGVKDMFFATNYKGDKGLFLLQQSEFIWIVYKFESINSNMKVSEIKFEDAELVSFQTIRFPSGACSSAYGNVYLLNIKNQEYLEFANYVERTCYINGSESSTKCESEFTIKNKILRIQSIGDQSLGCINSLVINLAKSGNKNKQQYRKDIYSLIGSDYRTLGAKIQFEHYSIINTGSGYLLTEQLNDSKDIFGVSFCYSLTTSFFLFIKYQTINNSEQATILDILQVNRTDLKENKIVEYCETKQGSDIEILALAKNTKDNPDYYYKILKAWRANRKTGKFESVKRRKVKKCGNESAGI